MRPTIGSITIAPPRFQHGQVGGADCTFPVDGNTETPLVPPPSDFPQADTPHDQVSSSFDVSLPSSNLITMPNNLLNPEPAVECELNQKNEDIPAGQGRVLPPQQNRGKPPVRYSPGKVSKGGKYPVIGARGFLSSVCDATVPRTVEEAMLKPKWCEAMEEEMRALRKNGT